MSGLENLNEATRQHANFAFSRLIFYGSFGVRIDFNLSKIDGARLPIFELRIFEFFSPCWINEFNALCKSTDWYVIAQLMNIKTAAKIRVYYPISIRSDILAVIIHGRYRDFGRFNQSPKQANSQPVTHVRKVKSGRLKCLSRMCYAQCSSIVWCSLLREQAS